MTQLVDTDVLVDIYRQYPPAVAWFDALTDFPGVPGFVAMELFAGCRNSSETGRVETFLRQFPVYWPGESMSQSILAQFPLLHLRDGLGVLDALVGACALQAGVPLCTFNVRHYRSIPGLRVEQPYRR